MKKILWLAFILPLCMAGCNPSRNSVGGLLSLHQADSVFGSRKAFMMPYGEFRDFIDSLKGKTSAGDPVSDEYFFHSLIYGYNLNHSLQIPYRGFTTDPDYHELAAGVRFDTDSLLKNEEYCKFIGRYLDLTAKYMIEAGDAHAYRDNLFINTQFDIARKQMTGEVKQYALYRIMMLQINTFGIDNTGKMYADFRNECHDAAWRGAVEGAYEKQMLNYGRAEKTVYKVVGTDSLNAYMIYPGTRIKNMPCIVMIHEGGWYNGQPGEMLGLSELFSQLGYVAISIEYRTKARQNATPADALRDVKSAIRWVRENAAKLSIDPHRVLAGGYSAGGHLAAATALIPGYEHPGQDTTIKSIPDAVILWSACVDPTVDAWFSYCLRGSDDPVRLSPTDHVVPGAPPFLIFQGTNDEFLDYRTHIAFRDKLEKAGDYCNLVVYEGISHFQVEQQDMRPVIETFLHDHLQPVP